MNDTRPKKKKPATRRGPTATGQAADQLPSEYISIRVPIPPASAFNKERPPGLLLQAQLQHFRHAESARLPKKKRDGRRPEDIDTEAKAADYIAKITQLLHPQRRRKPRPPAST
jgi:hypothetical protein